jgi:tetratricopeptide (TPR) repeat protein
MKWLYNFITSNSSPGIKAQGYLWKGFYHFFLGQYSQSLIDLNKMKELMIEAGNEYGVAVATLTSGCVYLEMIEYKQSISCFEEFQDDVKDFIHPSDFLASSQMLAKLDVLVGKIGSAKSKLEVCEQLVLKFSEKNPYWGMHFKSNNDCLRIEIMLAECDFKKAVALGEKLDSLEMVSMGIRDLITRNIPFLQDVLARAYYLNGELDKAITEYERLLTFDAKSNSRLLINPKYHYCLAKLYKEKGWKEKAISEFEKFLDLWKNADKDLPEPIDAKKRLAKLIAE